jgi:hypothetical protein
MAPGHLALRHLPLSRCIRTLCRWADKHVAPSTPLKHGHVQTARQRVSSSPEFPNLPTTSLQILYRDVAAFRVGESRCPFVRRLFPLLSARQGEETCWVSLEGERGATLNLRGIMEGPHHDLLLFIDIQIQPHLSVKLTAGPNRPVHNDI